MLVRITMFFETEQGDFHKEITIEKVLLNAERNPAVADIIESTLLRCAQDTIATVRTVADGFISSNLIKPKGV